MFSGTVCHLFTISRTSSSFWKSKFVSWFSIYRSALSLWFTEQCMFSLMVMPNNRRAKIRQGHACNRYKNGFPKPCDMFLSHKGFPQWFPSSPQNRHWIGLCLVKLLHELPAEEQVQGTHHPYLWVHPAAPNVCILHQTAISYPRSIEEPE